jgi:hypothetical protein
MKIAGDLVAAKGVGKSHIGSDRSALPGGQVSSPIAPDGKRGLILWGVNRRGRHIEFMVAGGEGRLLVNGQRGRCNVC